MSPRACELVRYLINGVAATAIHYLVLSVNLNILHFHSAALANMLAAVVGISASFLGSRYFVFRASGQRASTQAIKFALLYGAMAIMHGGVLLIWTDWLKLDFRIGFLIATLLQVSISYFGNRNMVFKEQHL